MQAFRLTQSVSADGYIHVRIPPNFTAKTVELIVLQVPDSAEETALFRVNEQNAEWDIDYDTSDAGFAQTGHTFDLLDYESGAEDPLKWR